MYINDSKGTKLFCQLTVDRFVGTFKHDHFCRQIMGDMLNPYVYIKVYVVVVKTTLLTKYMLMKWLLDGE
jgi:hypothetical protein